MCIIFDFFGSYLLVFEALILLPFGSHFAALDMKLSWLGMGPGLGGSRN